MAASVSSGPLVSLGGLTGAPSGRAPAEYSQQIGPSIFGAASVSGYRIGREQRRHQSRRCAGDLCRRADSDAQRCPGCGRRDRRQRRRCRRGDALRESHHVCRWHRARRASIVQRPADLQRRRPRYRDRQGRCCREQTTSSLSRRRRTSGATSRGNGLPSPALARPPRRCLLKSSRSARRQTARSR